MIVIADVNKLFSAAYTPNGVESMVISQKSNIQFISPDFVLEEFLIHLEAISKSIGISPKETKLLFEKILSNVRLVESKAIPKECVIKAFEMVKEIDPKDFPYVALHLSEGHKIWTGDKKLINGLKETGYDICITTPELRKYLYKR